MNPTDFLNRLQPVLTVIQPYWNVVSSQIENGRFLFENTVKTSPVAHAVTLATQKLFGYYSYLPVNKVPLIFSAVWFPVSYFSAMNSVKEIQWPLSFNMETLYDVSRSIGKLGILCNDGLHFLQNLQTHDLLIPQLNFLSFAIPGLIVFNTIAFGGRLSANAIEIYYAKTSDDQIASRLAFTAIMLDLIGVTIITVGVFAISGYACLTISVIVSLSRSAYNPSLKPDFNH